MLNLKWRSPRVTRSAAIVSAGVVLMSGCSMRVPADTVVSQGAAPGAQTTGTTGAPGTTTAATDTTGAIAPAPAAGAAAPGASDTAAGAGGAGGGAGTATTAGQSGGSGGAGSGKPAASAGQAAATGGTGGDIAISGANSQGITDTEVKIGVLAPVSGAAGFLGQNEVDGVNGYFGMLNAKGGVKGRTFRTVVVDTAFDPASEATGARRLVEQDKVFGLIGVLGDSPAPYVTSKGIPNVVLGITSPAFASKYPTTYPMTLNTVESVVSMADYFMRVKKAPIKTVAVLYDTQNMNIKPWLDFMVKAWEVHGVKVVSTDAFNLSDANCDQLVTKMRNLKVDFWQAGQSLGWPICLAAAARQGYKPPFGIGGPYSADAKFVGGAGQGSNDVYAMTTGVQIAINTGQPYPQAKNNRAPEVDNYISSMKTYAPNSSDISSLENIWTQTSWVMAKLLAEAVSKQSQAITWKGVNQYIQSLTNWQSGLMQPVSFKPDCKTGGRTWIFQWKRQADGSLVQSDWKPYGGVANYTDSLANKILPGAGKCLTGKMADAGLQ